MHGNYLRAFFISFDNSPAQQSDNRRVRKADRMNWDLHT